MVLVARVGPARTHVRPRTGCDARGGGRSERGGISSGRGGHSAPAGSTRGFERSNNVGRSLFSKVMVLASCVGPARAHVRQRAGCDAHGGGRSKRGSIAGGEGGH